MKNRVITISRQFGSGGRTVGKKLAEQLNIPCYDQEIIEQLAEKTGLNKEYIKDTSEYMEYSGWLAGSFIASNRGGRSIQSDLWALQKRIIIKVAHEGPCVIVGRCADYILEDDADLLRVFVYADLQKRIERIERVYGEIEDNPEKVVRDKDDRREAYYHYYTHKKWGEPCNYDIALNSGTLGIDKCVDILAKLY